jgi:hypothetical protein
MADTSDTDRERKISNGAAGEPGPAIRAIQRKMQELLSHYSQREPKQFGQFDCHGDGGGWGMFEPDDDGDVIEVCFTWELMGGADVRVLIPRGTNPVAAARMLHKIADCLHYHAVAISSPQDELR